MTNDKAIKWLKVEASYIEEDVGSGKEILEAYDMAIEALEPCEDCISRTELLSKIDAERKHLLDLKMDGAEHIIVHHARRIIEDMPSVTSQPKIGHWIEDAKTYYEELNKRGLGVDEYTPYFVDDIACSECLAKYSVMDNETQFFKHCPNCGAKMEVTNADSD